MPFLVISFQMEFPFAKQSAVETFLTKWLKDFRESGDIPVRGSGNYASDEQKEIARLRRELRDAQDALDVLKKAINILGK